jgi:HK97 family phage major capsid protein
MLEEIKSGFESVKSEVTEKFEGVNGSIETLKNENAELKSQISVVKDEIEKLEAKSNRKTMNQNEVKSFNSLLAEGIEKNSDAIAKVGRHEAKNAGFTLDTKAITMTEAASMTGAIPREYANQVYAFPNRKVHLRQLLPVGSMSQGIFTFPYESADTGSVGNQTEGSTKSQLDFAITMQDAPAQYIAGFLKISRQMLDDVPGMTSFLQARLLEQYLLQEDAQLLNGNGTSPNLRGLTVAASAATGAATVDVEQLVQAIAQVESSNYSATGILINPTDWAAIVNTKNTASAYSLPASTVVTTDGTLSIAGIPCYKSTAIAADKFLVGDWNMGAQIMQHTGINVQFSEFDGTNFQQNLITVRVEARIAFPIYYGGAFVYGDFGNIA